MPAPSDKGRNVMEWFLSLVSSAFCCIFTYCRLGLLSTSGWATVFGRDARVFVRLSVCLSVPEGGPIYFKNRPQRSNSGACMFVVHVCCASHCGFACAFTVLCAYMYLCMFQCCFGVTNK